ncbi:MAG: AraC-like DNA-binding protein [Halieaceae bacterium]|jgi:AraC-like DNA-binding protein
MADDCVPTQYARTLLRMAVDRGVDHHQFLRSAGLSFDPLDETIEAAPLDITAMQYSRIYGGVLQLLQDESFGLGAGQGSSPGAFRMLCYCIISCKNLGKAIGRAAEFHETFMENEAQLYINFSDQSARVGYHHNKLAGKRVVDVTDGYAISVWHRFFGWLIGRPIKLDRVDFCGSTPVNPEKYEQLFGCPLYFNQPRNLMYFDSEYLRRPLVHTEQSLEEFLRTAPYQLLVMSPEHMEGNVVAQVRAMIGHDFSHGFPGFNTIASALHMSAPTLRRRLRREGMTFQALKDKCREEAAIGFLRESDQSINAIAYLTGFTDPSAFHRSFKKWTGITPGQFREKDADSTVRDRDSAG